MSEATATRAEPAAAREIPTWKAGAIYYLFPRSFADSDGDGFGDLRGVIDRLDHLSDGTESSLGVSAIWLSPIYPSPWRDGGYDVADHVAIDPQRDWYVWRDPARGGEPWTFDGDTGQYYLHTFRPVRPWCDPCLSSRGLWSGDLMLRPTRWSGRWAARSSPRVVADLSLRQRRRRARFPERP